MILIKTNQSVFDLVTQHLGDVKAAVDFVFENGLSLTQDLEATTTAILPDTDFKNQNIVEYYTAQSIELATGNQDTTAEPLGIGTMIIQSDFDVL